jgi:alkylation response protein AidB-like acyl-CoA dehydrogenase
VAAARVALAHQLIASSRWMLDAARTHAIDREQFGRPVASFQAVRHKLAESLVAIEGADSVTGACTIQVGGDVDPLLAAVAKSLAGKAARTSATHAQQVLAGIGFTTDHEFHLWLKRTLVVDTVFGSASSIPTELGDALLAAGTAPRLLEL